ncbi:hypothetical protein PIB30_032267 [Stylosanthes scabra]|uniref:Uncharacterized protein n=1 Tax=Stylosanthes scabra TaxID=79078 RepID=A0ABU6XA96_9FABA|nr:hypothetical protein [Stylosanthes scabra]
MSWTWPGNTWESFDSWTSCSMNKEAKKEWVMYHFAVIWVIWKTRNEYIFKGEEPKLEDAKNLVNAMVKIWKQELGLRLEYRRAGTSIWYPELRIQSIIMALILSSQSKVKNGSIPLSDKLDKNNFSTWRKSILLILRALKLQSHLDSSQTLT